MPRFMLEGPQRAQSFVLPSYTMHELRNQNVSIGQFLGQWKATIGNGFMITVTNMETLSDH